MTDSRRLNSALFTFEVTFLADDADGDHAFAVALALRDFIEQELQARTEVRGVQAEPFKIWSG